MPLPKDNYSMNDIYNLPDGTRAELIDNQLYMMSPPKRIHQEVLGWLYANLYQYTAARGNCKVYPAPFAVFLNKDDKTYLEPDISVICDKDKLNEMGCDGAPDFIIEIVSPSTASHDYITKLNLYKTAGVREYWIVNPTQKTVLVYFFEGDIWAKPFSFKDVVKVNIDDHLMIDFAKLDL